MPFTPIILCVDDDEDDLFFIKDIIESQGHNFEIKEAHNGWDALNYLEQGLKKNEFPCLIIMDMNMPRMDGLEALAQIKADPALRRIPVVVLTTSRSEKDIYRSYDLGANSYIGKPVTFSALVEVMRSLGRYWFEIVQLPT